MDKKFYIKLTQNIFHVTILTNHQIADRFCDYLPLTSEANNIGGEVYFRVPAVDISFDGSERVDFSPGDVVYWRAPDGSDTFSVALLYGPTEFGDWKACKTFSPCVKIGEIVEEWEDLKKVKNGELVTLFLN